MACLEGLILNFAQDYGGLGCFQKIKDMFVNVRVRKEVSEWVAKMAAEYGISKTQIIRAVHAAAVEEMKNADVIKPTSYRFLAAVIDDDLANEAREIAAKLNTNVHAEMARILDNMYQTQDFENFMGLSKERPA